METQYQLKFSFSITKAKISYFKELMKGQIHGPKQYIIFIHH